MFHYKGKVFFKAQCLIHEWLNSLTGTNTGQQGSGSAQRYSEGSGGDDGGGDVQREIQRVGGSPWCNRKPRHTLLRQAHFKTQQYSALFDVGIRTRYHVKLKEWLQIIMDKLKKEIIMEYIINGIWCRRHVTTTDKVL